ncbi:MAG: hypothetical protein RSB70_06060 [Clostridium sp.]
MGEKYGENRKDNGNKENYRLEGKYSNKRRNERRYVITIVIATIISITIMISLDIHRKLNDVYFIERYNTSVDEYSKNINNISKKVKKDKSNNRAKEVDKIEKESESYDANIYEKYRKKFEEMKKKYEDEYSENITKEELERTIEECKKEKGISDVKKSLFKVHTYDILPSLSSKDKKELIGIGKYLSTSDYKKIVKYLKGDDQEKGIVDAITIIKDKIPQEEYNKVKDIANRFIDMNVLDTYLKP